VITFRRNVAAFIAAAILLGFGLAEATTKKECEDQHTTRLAACDKLTNTNPQMGPTKEGCRVRSASELQTCLSNATSGKKENPKPSTVPSTRVAPKVKPGTVVRSR
jgi:hypothetical protein